MSHQVFNDSGLKELYIPESVKWLATACLAYCDELEKVVIDAPLEVLPYNCFSCNKKLKNVELCEGIKETGPFAFEKCSSLETIVFPASMTYIDYMTLTECPSLTTIQCNAVTPPETNSNPFDESLYAQATLMVPQQSIEAYKSADCWKQFFNITGITTAIDGITVNSPSNHERIYDLRGMEMKAEKGLFIKNGIKVKKK